MRSKKAIVWSTLIGITIASLILINVIVPILAAGYRILFPEPNYSSLQGFDRLSYAAMNAPYNGKMIVPIDLENGLKITTNANDPNCAINCLCLCKADGFASGQKQPGCLIRMYKETCFDSPVNFHGQFSTITPGVMINVVAILQVSRSTSAIDVTGEYSGKCYFDN